MTMRSSIAGAQISGPLPNPDGTAVLEYRFSPNDPTFAGHFPAHPVLPGVFRLELVRLAAEAVLNCRLAVREICKAKFLRPIVPGETLRVELKLSEQDGAIQARAGFSVGGQPAGETVLRLWRSD